MSWADALTTYYPLHVSVEGVYLGVGKQKSDLNWFNYCPACGNIWARGIIEKENAGHIARCVPCSLHGGGSLLQAHCRNEEKLPETVEFMKYELDLYCKNPETYYKRHGLFRAH